MVPIKYNLRSLYARRVTALAAVTGVALVTLVLAASLMLSEGVKKTLGASGRATVAVVLRRGSNSELNSMVADEAVGVVLAAPGVRRQDGRPAGVAEVVVVLALPKLGATGFSNVTLRGITEESIRLRPQVRLLEGRMPRPGSDEAAVGARVRGRFPGLAPGESFDLRRNRPIHVVGVLEDGGGAAESEVWIDRDTLRAAFGRQGVVSSMHVELDDPARFDAFRAAVEHDKRLGLEAQAEPAFLDHQSESLSLFLRVMGTTVAVFFSVGAIIGATITMHAAVASRTREIGTLRALGFSRRSILGGIVLETVVLTMTGGLVGALLSTLLAFVKVSMINYATWSELVFAFSPTMGIILRSVAFAAGMGLLGGLFPALRASRISPLAAMRA